MTKINLGCGNDHLPDFCNIDKEPAAKPDMLLDLERCMPWPFGDNEVTEVRATHVLEHIGADVRDFFRVIRELYRVMAPGAEIHIAVPHHRSDNFDGDPTHVRKITAQVLSLLSKQNCRLFKQAGAANTPLADYLDVDFEIVAAEMALSPLWEAKRASMAPHELMSAIDLFNNVVEEVRFRVRKVGPQ